MMPGHAGWKGNRLMTPNDITIAMRSRQPVAALRALRAADAIGPDYDTRWEEGAMVDNSTIEGVTPPPPDQLVTDDDVSVCDECHHAGSVHVEDLDNPTCWAEFRCATCVAEWSLCPVCGGRYKDATIHASSKGHFPTAGTNIVDEDAMVAHLDRVRSAWSAFLDEYRGLFEAFRASDIAAFQQEAYRIDAYQPGGDPGRDWGMGMAASTWFDEFEAVIRQKGDR